ncbi:helix-turn-helix domain-containing protein [Nocardia sp. NPDC051570]|uniref:helix-turn-helix domain-containing protein n=1 Tax=Nocardia sp. NPDC051570 TaxID=3364324 RepID=UPI00379A9474
MSMDVVEAGQFTVGERMEMRRRRRGLSRKVVAERVGRSEEWLRAVETGRRRLDSVEVIMRLADVLDIADPGELVDRPAQPVGKGRDSTGELAALGRAVIDHPALRIYEGHRDIEQIDAASIAVALRRCSRVWTGSPRRYSILAQRLPRVLTASRLIRWQRRDDETAELLIWAYHLARRLATACGEHDLAAVVADRAMGTAAQLHRRSLVAASAWHVGHALVHRGQFREGHDYALSAARRLGADPPADGRELTLWGALHLVAACAAIGARDLAESSRLVWIAERAAAESHSDAIVFGVPFGPVHLGITRVEIALARRDPTEALRLAAEVDVPQDYPIGDRARHHIRLARAYSEHGDEVAAAFALNKAVAISPEDVCHDAAARQCVEYLLAGHNPLIRHEVTRLSALMSGA